MTLSEARILFVDDEPLLLEIFAQWVAGDTPHQITTAIDGQEALEKLALHDYDLIITDVNMPRVDGPELVRRMTAMGKVPPSIVFVSGFGDVDQREMYGLGVEAFLSKPVPRDALLLALRHALSGPGELWQTPIKTPARHTLTLQAHDFSDCAASASIGLGRGGFSACYVNPVAPGKVNFECHLSGPDICLVGVGYVRWKSRSEGMIGVEIIYLEECCRSIVIEQIMRTRPKAFIPYR